MTGLHVLFVILFCMLVGSFTWGMRGTILGGERGAMLPGAALALAMLYAGGDLPLRDAFPMAAVAGAAGMFFGGSQTYGETITLSHDADAGVRRYARFGLAVKGAGWFGVFGGILAFAMSAWSGRFVLWQAFLFVLLLPIVKWLGVLAFNFPQKPKENRFPKIYFSQSRFEVWGGLLFLCIYFCLFGCILREWLMPLMTVFGFVFGALGFWSGNLFQTALDAEKEKGLFAFLQRSGVCSSWKAMECIFGAFGGLGMGLGWCILYPYISRTHLSRIVSHSGIWDAFADKTDNIFLFVWLFLFALFVARYFVSRDVNRFTEVLYRYEDVWIYPVFCYIPLFLASTGNFPFARIFSVAIMLFLLAEKVSFAGTERFETIFGSKVLQSVLIAVSAVALALQLFTRLTFSAYATFAVYMISYLLVFAYTLFCDARFGHAGRKGIRSSMSWAVWALVCTLVLLVPGWFYFK